MFLDIDFSGEPEEAKEAAEALLTSRLTPDQIFQLLKYDLTSALWTNLLVHGGRWDGWPKQTVLRLVEQRRRNRLGWLGFLHKAWDLFSWCIAGWYVNICWEGVVEELKLQKLVQGRSVLGELERLACVVDDERMLTVDGK